MECEIAVVTDRVSSWLNGNPNRLVYERLIHKRVSVIPGSEFEGQGRCRGKKFVLIQPLADRLPKAIPIRKDFLEFETATVAVG